MNEQLCKSCGRPMAHSSNRRCVPCRVTATMQTFDYTPAEEDYGEMGEESGTLVPYYGVRNPARNRVIADMVMGGMHAGEVALRFGLSRGTVLNIVREARGG